MKWTEVKIRTTSEASDAVCDMLTTIGAGGMAIEDPNDIRMEIQKAGSLDYADDDFLNNLGEDVVIKAYFPEHMNQYELAELIKEKISFISNFLDTGLGLEGYKQVDDEDWATAWKQYYKPFHISDRVVIKPTWEDYQANEGEIVIHMDPGMAFGTGTHETTKMCAQLLEKYVAEKDAVIDVGCGTGILSIIAVKLGASSVTSVDVDEVAVRVTKENCSMNGVTEEITAFKGVLNDIPEVKADVVVANIIATVIVDLSGWMNKYLKKGGYLITSGIIKERKEEVEEAYRAQGFTCEETMEMGEWVAMVFTCRNSL